MDILQWLDATPQRVLKHVATMVPKQHGGAQGFIRIANREACTLKIDIAAIDDTGERFEGTGVSVGAKRQSGFNSNNLEDGHETHSGLIGVGDGEGMWRLELTSDGEFEVQSYARVPGGFVTALHDTAPALEGVENTYYVPFFNPGSNRSVRSVLRIVNPNDQAVEATIDALDALEAGDAAKFTGALGDGTGKWRLTVAATLPVDVVSLLAARTGHVTNVSR